MHPPSVSKSKLSAADTLPKEASDFRFYQVLSALKSDGLSAEITAGRALVEENIFYQHNIFYRSTRCESRSVEHGRRGRTVFRV